MGTGTFFEGYQGRHTAIGSWEEQGLYLVTRKIRKPQSVLYKETDFDMGI